MKRLLRVILLLAIGLWLMAGCGNGAEEKKSESTQSEITKSEGITVFSAEMPVPAAAAALQPGESVEIQVTPELREYYFGLARMEDWFHIPRFDSLEDLPTDPLEYWFMLMQEGRTGWDENGSLTGISPWLRKGVPDVDNYFSIMRYDKNGNVLENESEEAYVLALSVEELDNWVHEHFGDVPLQHEIVDDAWHGKNYYFDGETYYHTCNEGTYPDYWELVKLAAENVDNRIVYTVTINWLRFNEYSLIGLFWYDESLTPEENQKSFDERIAEADPELLAINDAYGQQIWGGEISLDKAVEQMIIDGQTENFKCGSQMQIKYYLNEQTNEPFYLAVNW